MEMTDKNDTPVSPRLHTWLWLAAMLCAVSLLGWSVWDDVHTAPKAPQPTATLIPASTQSLPEGRRAVPSGCFPVTHEADGPKEHQGEKPCFAGMWATVANTHNNPANAQQRPTWRVLPDPAKPPTRHQGRDVGQRGREDGYNPGAPLAR